MDERLTDQELQSPDTWDMEKAETKSPRKSKRVVTSVAFNSEDFGAVVDAAEKAGMKTSEYIRAAALEKAQPSTGEVSVTWQGGVGGTFSIGMDFEATTHGSQGADDVSNPLDTNEVKTA